VKKASRAKLRPRATAKPASRRAVPLPIRTTSKAGKKPQAAILELQPAPPKRLLLTDVALRDGHQSLLATRMRTEDLLPVAERLDKVGYWSLEAWGGATFDTCLRFLKEDPWERLRALKRAMPHTRL
jgi:pyruvate carboxylase subunit B